MRTGVPVLPFAGLQIASPAFRHPVTAQPAPQTWPAPRRRVEALAVTAILVLAALYRLWHLHAFPPATDEIAYAKWSVDIWRDHTRAGLLIPIIDDGKPPLLFWIEAVLYGLGLPPVLAGRLLSAGAGILTAALCYALARRFYGPIAGLAAGGFYAVVPFAVWHDRLSLVDAPLTLAVVVVAYAAGRAATTGAWRWSGLAALAGLCAVGIKGPGVMAAVLPCLAWVLLARTRRQALRPLLTPAVLIVALYGFMMYGPLGWRFRYMVAVHSIDLRQSLPALVRSWAENADVLRSYLAGYFPSIWLALLAGSLLLPLWTRRREDLFMLAGLAAMVLPVILYGWEIYSRYFLPGLPFIALLWGRLVALLSSPLQAHSERWLDTPARYLVSGIAALLLLPLAWQSGQIAVAPEHAAIARHDRWQYITGFPSGWGLREATDAIEQDAAGRLVFVLTTAQRSVTRDFVYLRFLDHPTIRHYVEWEVRQGTRSSLTRWLTHGVPIYLVANSGREEPESIERNWPDATIVARVPRPGGESEVVVYRLPMAR
jgi:hypothetical protein